MASVIYRLCDGVNRTMVTITNDWASSEATRYYTLGSCSITEKTRVLRFTASRALPTSYTINYLWTRSQEEDGMDYGEPLIMHGSITMPIGQTVVTREVITYQYSNCTDDTGGIRLIEAPL